VQAAQIGQAVSWYWQEVIFVMKHRILFGELLGAVMLGIASFSHFNHNFGDMILWL